MSRIVARETLMKLVFGLNFNNTADFSEFWEVLDNPELAIEDKEYINKNLDEIKTNYTKLLNIIDENLKGFKIDRISKVDLTILLVAVNELLTKIESEKVVINEAVELAKKYSDKNNYKFINGILGQISKGNYEL